MRNLFKKTVIVLVGIFILTAVPAWAQENTEEVNLYMFWMQGCPHCGHEIEFLQSLDEKYEWLSIYVFEVSSSRANAKLMELAAQKLGVFVSGVPFTIIGDEVVSGFLNAETTGKEIEKLVLENKVKNIDIVGELLAKAEETAQPTPSSTVTPTVAPAVVEEEKPEDVLVHLPIIGEIDWRKTSLPVFTGLVAILDGFNPCAMWALVFLISLLLGMQDRRRMWLLGSVFILTSAVVYYLILAAWLNLFLVWGYLFWMRLLIGVIAVGLGIYQLKSFVKTKSGVCEVSQGNMREKVLESLKLMVQQRFLGVALLGVALLGAVVNLIEFACSAGLPAVYTNILSLAGLSGWQYYAYLLLYVIIFMLDDLAIFIAAMMTLKVTGVGTKYAHYTKLVGGMLMVAVGVLLIFKPEWLMMG
jgi:hypothetical protein